MTSTIHEESDHHDLHYYHERDPEPKLTQSASPVFTASGSSDDCEESLFAMGSMGDETISTIANTSLKDPSISLVHDVRSRESATHVQSSPRHLEQKLQHVSPVSQTSSAASPPVQRYSMESPPGTSIKSPLEAHLSPHSRHAPSTPRPGSSDGSFGTSTTTPKQTSGQKLESHNRWNQYITQKD